MTTDRPEVREDTACPNCERTHPWRDHSTEADWVRPGGGGRGPTEAQLEQVLDKYVMPLRGLSIPVGAIAAELRALATVDKATREPAKKAELAGLRGARAEFARVLNRTSRDDWFEQMRGYLAWLDAAFLAAATPSPTHYFVAGPTPDECAAPDCGRDIRDLFHVRWADCPLVVALPPEPEPSR